MHWSLFSLLGLMFLVPVAIFINQSMRSSAAFQFSQIVAASLGLVLACLCVIYVVRPRIELGNQKLRATAIIPGSIPRAITHEAPLSDIDCVFFGAIGYLRHLANDPGFHDLKQLIAAYETLSVKGFSLRAAVQFTPLIFVLLKREAKPKSFAITTKPFSKKGAGHVGQIAGAGRSHFG